MPWAGNVGRQCQSMQLDQMSGLLALLSQELSQVSCFELSVHAACTWKQCKCDMTGVIIFQLCLPLQVCRMNQARPLQPSSHHQLQLYAFAKLQLLAVNCCTQASAVV